VANVSVSTVDGGFAEYCAYPAAKLFRFEKLSWVDATLFEAASCAVHGLEWLQPKVGSKVLLIGSGATGLCLGQLLRNNGGQHVVLASNKGPKMDLAKKLDCADEFIELDRADPQPQWDTLKKAHPYGFDVVVEASGSHQIAEMAFDFVAKRGKLMYYGVYDTAARVSLPPARVFRDEITIMG
jgi:D-arabinitol dehydrogenase (NADP+)